MSDSSDDSTKARGSTERSGDTIPVGSTLDGFRIDGVLGAGGQGIVYRAWDLSAERGVALKTLIDPTDDTTGGLLNEVRQAARLKHPSIVPILYVTPEGKSPFYAVMELVDGASLSEVMKTEGALPEAAALKVVEQIAEGLVHAHSRGVTHLDLKPANVLIELESGRALISDFGMAIHHSQRWDLSPGGTLRYMAPEQLGGRTEQFDGRTDIWAVGVVMYELLTGKRPFGNDYTDTHTLAVEIQQVRPKPPSQWRPEVSKQADQICLRCLEKEIDDRYDSASRLLDDLQHATAQARNPLPSREEEEPLTEPLPMVALGGCLVAIGALVCGVLVAVGIVEMEDVKRFLSNIPLGRRR